MAQSSWSQEVITRFFRERASPSKSQCDDIARSMTGASAVSPVDSPGSMSYTVICSGRPNSQQDLVVSFRETGAALNDQMVQLARSIHGDIVPLSTSHGPVERADPPLCIYSMPFIQGTPIIETLEYEKDLGPEEELKQKTLIKYLARYFAKSWVNAQAVDDQVRENKKQAFIRRLDRLLREARSNSDGDSPLHALPVTLLSKLIGDVPALFDPESPQVLTHGDFSVTNILVDRNSFEITGVVDWSLASISPFGLDLDILFLATGFSTLAGWQFYTCRDVLESIFWDAFFIECGIDEEEHKAKIRASAQAAGRIGAITRLAFRRNDDGSPSEEVLVSASRMRQLKAWLG